MIKVLLAEDHNIVRNGIRSLLENLPFIEIVEEATNGMEAIQKISEGIIPDIVVADINMPEMDGLTLIGRLKSLVPDTKVLVLSMLEHEKYLFKAIDAGAWGYVLKSASKNELTFAIEQVAAGYKYICTELVLKLLTRVPVSSIGLSDEEKKISALSKREKEILTLIADGYTNSEIADMLFTSRRTVEGHRQNLIEKTGARNTAALIRLAVKTGLID